MSYRYQLGPAGPLCHLKFVFEDILDFSCCCNELRLWGMLGWGAYILHVNGQKSSEAGEIITLLG